VGVRGRSPPVALDGIVEGVFYNGIVEGVFYRYTAR